MSFVVRNVRFDDLNQLIDLTKQFALLNLPSDRKVLTQKIEQSVQSFAGQREKVRAEYLFVVEDLDEKCVVGSSLIMAKHGSEENPHSCFKVFRKDHFSEDLGLGFIHQVLRFHLDADGPTEIGGLLVDRSYRRRVEKLGKQISLARFLYIATHRERFEPRVLCELTPPLTDEGRSEFWEALGRRFTGLPYQEADLLSQSHREFIRSLFPEGDIYLTLLDAKARTVLGRVGEQTKPAQHLLESIGFGYLDEVDPFDGGPHFGAMTEDILPIRLGRNLRLTQFQNTQFKEKMLVAATVDEEFRCGLAACDIRENEIAIPPQMLTALGFELGQELFVSPFHYPQKFKEQV